MILLVLLDFCTLSIESVLQTEQNVWRLVLLPSSGESDQWPELAFRHEGLKSYVVDPAGFVLRKFVPYCSCFWLIKICSKQKHINMMTCMLGNNHYHIKYSGTSVYVLNPFQTLGLIPNRTYTKRIFPIRNKGKMINPFPWKKIILLLAYYIVHWWGCIK
jgi:hypothetical protein